MQVRDRYLGREFNVRTEEAIVATINKKYFTIGDQYVVMVYDDRCQDIVVAILLAIGLYLGPQERFRREQQLVITQQGVRGMGVKPCQEGVIGSGNLGGIVVIRGALCSLICVAACQYIGVGSMFMAGSGTRLVNL